MAMPEKMTGASMEISIENRNKLKQLFPNIISEVRDEKGGVKESINIDKLNAELGIFIDSFESRRERYGMDWPGKKESLKLVQTPSYATLKPCRAESINFDTAENLFIEGDNLEVLKLLQKSYYGKVKMIYIDPPYNTGKEFIYPDNYTESLETYLEYAGLSGGDGKKFSTNTPNEGRFHTKWLNMMYPRLYLARNLLKEDGVIFISIDDNEVSNLRKLCDEIFGEENYASEFILKSNPRGSQSTSYSATVHEYVLCYVKNTSLLKGLSIELNEEMIQDYNLSDENGKYRLLGLRLRGGSWRREDRPFLFYPIYVNAIDGSISLEQDSQHNIKVLPLKPSTNEEGTWRWGKDKLIKDINQIIAKEVTREGKTIWDIFQKDYLLKDGIQKETKPKTIWDEKEVNYQNGTTELKQLFDQKNIFDFPKPTFIVKKMINMICEESDIILDFFAGSATTAHAILDLNKQDTENRRFILIQLPEPCSEDSEAYKEGYKTISEIGKERIRRVIKKLNEEQQGNIGLKSSVDQDRGFKVLKLNKSNFKQWQRLEPSTPVDKIEEQLNMHIDHIDPKAKPEDLLYEILIKSGYMPIEKIENKTIAGKKVYSISSGTLLICLEETITKELIDAIAEAKPKQFICLDSAFRGNDQLKANAVQTISAHNMQKEQHNQIVFRTV